jgi:transposase
MDMSQAFISKVTERLPTATIVFDPSHVIKLANKAVDEARRAAARRLEAEQTRPVVADEVGLDRTRRARLDGGRCEEGQRGAGREAECAL